MLRTLHVLTVNNDLFLPHAFLARIDGDFVVGVGARAAVARGVGGGDVTQLERVTRRLDELPARQRHGPALVTRRVRHGAVVQPQPDEVRPQRFARSPPLEEHEADGAGARGVPEAGEVGGDRRAGAR